MTNENYTTLTEGDNENNLNKYGLFESVEVTDKADKISSCYVNEQGELIQSNNWISYKIDPSKILLTAFEGYTRSNNFYLVSFYSSDAPSSESFLGGRKGTYGGSTNNEMNKLDNIVIPEGTISIVLTSYLSTNEHHIYGIPYINLPENVVSESQKLRIGAYEAIEKSYFVGNDNYAHHTITDAFSQWETDGKPNAIIKVANEPPTHIYRVGENRQFTTPAQAVSQWVADGKPVATIFIDSGVYVTADNVSATANPLAIIGAENRLSIIGEDRKSTIIKATTGLYIHPPIDIQGGNVTVKNITFIAEHNDNPEFNYAEKVGNYNSAYAMHIDSGTVPGVIVVENCNCFSYQSQAVGCGTIPGSHIMFKNCDLRTFADIGEWTSAEYLSHTDPKDENGDYIPNSELTEEQLADRINRAKYITASRGAIIYHGSTSENATHESFSMINCSVYSSEIKIPIKVSRGTAAEGVGTRVLFFKDTLFKNLSETYTPAGIEKLELSQYSSGNNVSSMNDNGKGVAIKLEV